MMKILRQKVAAGLKVGVHTMTACSEPKAASVWSRGIEEVILQFYSGRVCVRAQPNVSTVLFFRPDDVNLVN